MCAAFRLKQQVWHKHHTALRAAADRLARIYADVGEHYTFIHACLQIFWYCKEILEQAENAL